MVSNRKDWESLEKERVSTFLLNALRERGWSSGMLAYKTGITPRTIRNYIAGRTRPNNQKIKKICKALGFHESVYYENVLGD